MNQKLDAICREVQKALTGKQAIVEKVLMAMLCGGHILLDDVPGVGKTTLAVAFSKALGLRYRRIQFTPDVLPSEHLLLYIQIRLHWHTAQRTNMYYIMYRRTYGELLRFLQRRISNYPMEMS